MSMTMTTKKYTVGFLIAMIMAFFMSFGSTIQAHADDIKSVNGVAVGVDSSGKLQVSGDGFTSGGSSKAWNELISKYQKFIVGISGIGAVTMIVLFIIAFLKLGASAGNPQARSQALTGVLWTGIAAAGLGAVTIIVGFFYNSIGTK